MWAEVEEVRIFIINTFIIKPTVCIIKIFMTKLIFHNLHHKYIKKNRKKQQLADLILMKCKTQLTPTTYLLSNNKIYEYIMYSNK